MMFVCLSLAAEASSNTRYPYACPRPQTFWKVLDVL